MSRALFGLVALLLSPSLAFSQATGTVVIQSPDGGTTFTGVVQGGVPVPAPGQAAARYNLSAMKNGFVMMSYGARSWSQPGRVLTVADRQDVDRVDFSLPRGGVITGRVLDEFGDPAVGVNVQPLRSTIMNGQRTANPMGSMVTTSDTGEFRIWGLMPGDYQVLATPQRSYGPAAEISDDRSGYASTYYPGTANAAEAILIPVA